MLRTALLGFAVLLTLVGTCFLLNGHANAWPTTLWGIILLAAVACERWRYRKPDTSKDEGWQKTDEQFIDPETGKTMQVWYHPATGERHYRPADNDKPSP